MKKDNTFQKKLNKAVKALDELEEHAVKKGYPMRYTQNGKREVEKLIWKINKREHLGVE